MESFSSEMIKHIARLDEALVGTWPKGLFEENSLVTPFSPIDVQRLVRKMACYVNMPYYTFLVAKDCHEMGVAGRIEWPKSYSGEVLISLSPDLYNYPQVAIKVLAHELSHQFMRFHRVEYGDVAYNERMTDVTSVYLGFGKYILNGDSYQVGGMTITPGYLSNIEFAHVYDFVCKLRNIARSDEESGLAPYALSNLKKAQSVFRGNDPKGCDGAIKYYTELRRLYDEEDLLFSNVDRLRIFAPLWYAKKSQVISELRRESVADHVLVDEAISRMTSSKNYSSVSALSLIYEREQSRLKSNFDRRGTKLKEIFGGVQDETTQDKVSAEWINIGRIIVECPKCNSRLRLPTGKTRIQVSCPKCGYKFDYSTVEPKVPRKSIFDEFKKAASDKNTLVVSKFDFNRKLENLKVRSVRIVDFVKRNCFTKHGLCILLFVLLSVYLVGEFVGERLRINERERRRNEEILKVKEQKRIAREKEKQRCEAERLYKEKCERNWWFVQDEKTARAAFLYHKANMGSLSLEQLDWIEKLLASKCRQRISDVVEANALKEELKNWEQDIPSRNGCLRFADFAKTIVYGQFGKFTVKTSGDANYILRFYNLSKGRVALDYFIRGGYTEEIWLPPGIYEVKYACGRKWYGSIIRFGLNAVYTKADKEFGVYSDVNWEISLYPVANGNLKTESISAAEFADDEMDLGD